MKAVITGHVNDLDLALTRLLRYSIISVLMELKNDSQSQFTLSNKVTIQRTISYCEATVAHKNATRCQHD